MNGIYIEGTHYTEFDVRKALAKSKILDALLPQASVAAHEWVSCVKCTVFLKPDNAEEFEALINRIYEGLRAIDDGTYFVEERVNEQ